MEVELLDIIGLLVAGAIGWEVIKFLIMETS